MTTANPLKRELVFALRNRSLLIWMAVVFLLSSIAVGFGVQEVDHQKQTIQRLLLADQQDRSLESKKLSDWGSAAYYSFHLTYQPPSDFAFAAMGTRDTQPWKHRIRMLALEGQIYERDVGNPSLAVVGRFDFAFLVAFIVPLVLIVLLHDLRTREVVAGRYHLIEANLRRPIVFWGLRASIPTLAIYLCLVLPLLVAGVLEGTDSLTLLLAAAGVLAYVVFWSHVCFLLSAWQKTGAVILMTLVCVWAVCTVVLPMSARYAIDRLIPLPEGAEILLLQRETVNDAWDLPRQTTMNAFFERHPEWSDYEPVESSFEWQWYYAFQQVGDQKTEALSNAYREGRQKRDQIAKWASWLAPPSLIERWLQSLADTDTRAAIRYDQSVRDYHAALRAYYYPKFFGNQPFDKKLLAQTPEFATKPRD